jgi:hypothetical protein
VNINDAIPAIPNARSGATGESGELVEELPVTTM